MGLPFIYLLDDILYYAKVLYYFTTNISFCVAELIDLFIACDKYVF